MRSYLFIILSTITVGAIGETEDFQLEGYYWRDYIGKIPKDALPGGLTSGKKPTYIGQVLHKELLIPAEINPEENKVIYEWGYQEHLATQNIKILCTPYPERFEWIVTSNELIRKIQNKNLINGGYETGATIYIGRKQVVNELSVGKIISTNIQATLNTVNGGKVYQHADYDILSYNPNIKSSSKPDIDVRVGTSTETTTEKCSQRNITIIFYN